MVGPGKILGVESGDYLYYDHLLMAEDEEGVILYAYDSTVWDLNDRLVYRQRAKDLVLVTVPFVAGSVNHNWDFHFPVILFDRHPEAVQARLEIAVPGQKDGYVVKCQRNHEGYLIGEIVHKGDYYSSTKTDWIMQLSALSDSSSATTDLTVIPVHVCLYDVEGELIHEETIELYSVAYENQERQKGGT